MRTLTTCLSALTIALLVASCHGKGTETSETDSISFADTMTIDLHPEDDQSIVNTAVPVDESTPKAAAPEDGPEEENADAEATATETDDAASDASADKETAAPATSDEPATGNGKSEKTTKTKKDKAAEKE